MYRVFIFILMSLMLYSPCSTAFTPLPADEAFALSIRLNDHHQLIARWDIAPGYYLYRNDIRFLTAPSSEIKIGSYTLPQGIIKKDMVHGAVQTYSNMVNITLPLLAATSAEGNLNLKITYKGCSKDGFCYPPITKSLVVNADTLTTPRELTSHIQETVIKPLPAEHQKIPSSYTPHPSPLIILSFLGLGLLLAFTPCVLPMVPILSAIIIGDRQTTKKNRAILLSLAYVAGTTITYTIAGIVVALIGSNIQAELQQPWIIVLLSGIFVLLALSLFGLYEIQVPSRWQKLITRWSQHQRGGTYLGAMLMGSISTLIVSPCVSAPLVGALTYIGQTGNVWVGGAALFALGTGMGIPLILLGASAEKLLPKTGHWMQRVEQLFGIVMLGMAVWMLSRIIPSPVTLLLWSMLSISVAFYLAVYIRAKSEWQFWLKNAFAALFLIYAIILVIGVIMGNTNPVCSLSNSRFICTPSSQKQSPFYVVKSVQQLEQQLASAQAAGKPVILDFYADWCTSCVIMDKKIFAHPEIQSQLSSFALLRADITKNNTFDHLMLKRFNVVGPPTILFFDAHGRELTSERITGEVSKNQFLEKIKNLSD